MGWKDINTFLWPEQANSSANSDGEGKGEKREQKAAYFHS